MALESDDAGGTGAIEKREPDEAEKALVKKTMAWYRANKKHYRDEFKQAKANRKLMRGKTRSGGKARANLLHSTAQGLMPFIYAKNPTISVKPSESVEAKRKNIITQVADTMAIVVNSELKKAGLKKKAKACVRSAFSTSWGWVKIVFQRDIQTDPEIQSRLNDAQDNMQRLNAMIAEADGDESKSDETEQAELEQMRLLVESLKEKMEVVIQQGLTIDRVRTEDMIVDRSIEETEDYPRAPRIAQQIFMTKDDAKARFGADLDLEKATVYQNRDDEDGTKTKMAKDGEDTGQHLILCLEIWDKDLQTVFTAIEGIEGWARPPFHPQRNGERFYPFFGLAFWPIDGEFWPMSLIDLVGELQEDYNDANDDRSETRRKAKPHWVADAGALKKKDIQTIQHAELGEIAMIEANGQRLDSVMVQAPALNINPALFDTGYIRADIDMVTGLQDAARGAVLKPKTLGEAEILQGNLSGRTGEAQDTIEDWLQDIAQYAAEVLLLELSSEHVQDIAGPEAQWPNLDKEQVFDLVEVSIMAGTTGKPDKAREQKVWGEILPIIQGLVEKIIQAKVTLQQAQATAVQQGLGNGAPVPDIVTPPLIALLKETLRRFDESLTVEQFLPEEEEQDAPPPLGDATQNIAGAIPPQPVQPMAPQAGPPTMQ